MPKNSKRIIQGLFIILVAPYSFAQTHTTTFGGGYIGHNYSYKGDWNIHIGAFAGFSATSNTDRNVFVGYKSGYHNNRGSRNTFLGYYSGFSSRGHSSTILGSNAGSNSRGDYNVFIGGQAAQNSNGSHNVIIGHGAKGSFLSASAIPGSNNVMIGRNAGYNNKGASNLFLGNYSGYNETGSNKLYIDNSSTTNPLIWGDFSSNYLNVGGRLGINDKTPSYPLDVSGDIRSTGTIRTNAHKTSANWEEAYDKRINTVSTGLTLGSNSLTLNTTNSPISSVRGSFTINGNGRANRYEDLNNTAYYVDPASTSKLNQTDANYYDLNSGNGKGIRFWNSDHYKIHMGNSTEYKYGPVQDYSIKHNMSNNGNRGWTWGVIGTVPVAALNTQGKLQIKNDFTSEGNIYGKRVNNQYSNLYRFGGIFFTWDSDSYGTNTHHSIRSTNGDSYGNHLTMNSYGNLRFNFDSNNNGTNTFQIGHATSGTGNVLFHLNEEGKLGLGTTSPTTLLDVKGGITAQSITGFDLENGGISGANYNITGVNELKINDPGEGINFHDKARVYVIDDATDDKLYLGPGNVGIGIAPAEKLHINGAVRGNATGGALRVKTQHGVLDLGPQNSSWSHFGTDRNRFYFNKGITVDKGLIGSYDEDLFLQTSGITAISIANSDQQVNIINNLSIGGELTINKSNIIEDNTQDDLMVMRGNGTIATRSIRSIESPWLLDLVGQDDVMMCDPEIVINVDVFDLNGNLRIGDNSYIDDDLEYGDNGADENIPDDWMKFSDRIEFKSSHDDYGIVLFDKSDFSQFLNLHHESNTSYFANGANAANYFMKAEGLDVTFGGVVTVPSLNTSGYSSETFIDISSDTNNDSDDATPAENIVFGANGTYGTANYREIMRLEESGDVFIHSLPENVAVTGLVVRDPATGQLYSREASTVGPWDIKVSNDIHYNDGMVGLGLPDDATQTLDIGSGSIRIRNMSTSATAEQLVVVDSDGNFLKRNTSTLDLSPWTKSPNTLAYEGSIALGLSGAEPSQQLDLAGTARLRDLATNTLTSEVLVADQQGVLHKRDFSTFSPWTLDADNSYYSNERIGIGGQNPSADISTSITTTLQVGLNVNTTNTTDLAYGIRSEVSDEHVKAFAAIDNTTGNDVFRVFGNGVVEAKEVLVSLDVWNDHVFYPQYDLMPLEKVEEFVKENHHLPEVPSEKEVLENGMNVGEMEALLIKKVEELTLYIIEQNKQLKEQAADLEQQAEKIERLEGKLN